MQTPPGNEISGLDFVGISSKSITTNTEVYLRIFQDQQDFLLSQLIANDSLKQWERLRRHTAEKTIFIATRIISSGIAATLVIVLEKREIRLLCSVWKRVIF